LDYTAAIDFLKSETERCSMSLSAETLTGFRSYLEALYKYNEKVNLVSNADPEVVVKRHILDCLALVEAMDIEPKPDTPGVKAKRLLDIGSGAGLPGLIIAIAVPDLKVTLIDSVGKKTKFLQEVIEELALSERVKVITGRAEELARSRKRGTFDFVTSRAVGHLGIIIELAMPCLNVGGRLLCQKSRSQVEKEVDDIKDCWNPLGGRRPKIIVPKIQVAETEHVIVSIEKKRSTPDDFPRPWADIIRHWKQTGLQTDS